MRYKDLIIEGEEKLRASNIDVNLSHLLINHYLNIKEIDKITNKLLTNRDVTRYREAVKKLIKGEPPQYIMGHVIFYGYNFKISKDTLIPRFETEELVYNTIKYIKKKFKKETSIVDIGTGSGVIGITLKKELPDVSVTVTDISKKALALAKANAATLNADISVIKSNMLEKINDKYDVIISNPPYIKEDAAIMEIVKEHEPHLALYGGKDGLKYYRCIFENASKILKERFLIAFEIDELLVEDLVLLIKKHFSNSQYEFKKDMQGRKRMLFIYNN